jgi:lysine 2,3-aminomutase
MKKEEPVFENRNSEESKSLEPPSNQPDSRRTTHLADQATPSTVFTVSIKSVEFLTKHFPGTSITDWNNWYWQIRNSFTTLDQLNAFMGLSEEESSSKAYGRNLPVRITPYYASLLDPENPLQPLRRTVVPVSGELILSPGEAEDPLSENHDSPVPLIVHRYPDRVLFLVTNFCSAFCRYCTRTHLVSNQEKTHSSQKEWDIAIEYIREHTEIRDVLISGGDPLTLSDNRIEYLLSRLHAIPHVEIIRIGTKVPVVMPQRITRDLVSMLKKYHPFYLSIHFTHPDEITPEVKDACLRLADAGIPLGSQTVLLKGINDDVSVFRKLTHELLKIRVKPYYLYQCDPIPGSAHFRTALETGLDIIRNLRGFTSGYAIPHFVIDAPGGGGKIPLLPDYLIDREGDDLILKNYEGKTYRFPDYI